MRYRVILIGCVNSCEIGRGCIKFQYNASSCYWDYTLNVDAKLLLEFLSPKRAITCKNAR